MGQKIRPAAPVQTVRQAVGLALGSVLFFFAVCLGSAGTVRSVAPLLILLTLAAAFLFWDRLRNRLKPPILALAVVVAMDALSCAYAVSGKFALNELLKVMTAFCLALLLLAFLGADRPDRRAAIVLEGFGVVAGLVSIDLLSTRWISTPVLTILGWFTADYMNLAAVEEGVRMTSVLIYPNTFATCVGVGTLLGLGLTVSSEKRGERAAHLVCLFVNALAFVLVFSMGACVMIVPAFLVLLALTGKEQRTGMLILMVETLAVTMLAAVPISMTSMTAWTGFRPIPLLCTMVGAAALCALDLLAGRRIVEKLRGHGKAVLELTAVLLAAAAALLVAAYNLTTGITLQAGETLRRSAYPEPGAYILTADADSDPTVVVESQNRTDTIVHTSSELYSGPLSQAAFTVPEDSLVVYFNFRADTAVRLDSVRYSGENGSGSVPLGYRLLPAFIANRLQGLWANQNAIQRFAFYEDGLKLFRRSPIIGQGLGAYGNGVNGVQSFYYFTWYAHNEFIQAMVETGIVGLILLIGLLVVSGISIWRGRKKPMSPALGAALVFLVCHGMLDGVFSYFATLPMVYSIFAAIDLGCGEDCPRPAWAEKQAAQNGLAVGICAMLAVVGILLGCNSAARNMAEASPDFDTLERAAALDPFEWADYMLTYVSRVTGTEPDEETRQKADEYAVRLGKVDSNIIPYYLAEYYLDSGRTAQGLAQAERYVRYVSADAAAWQKTFELLEKYERDTPEYRAGVSHIADLLDAWNEDNMGHIELDGQARAFIGRMRA